MLFKPHSWVEINKKALKNNLSQLKKIAGEGTVAPVIKGNAYGHGLLEVGRVCQDSPDVGFMCVASLSEALTLREKGITKPVLVMVFLDKEGELAVEHNIDVMVYNLETLSYLNACAQKKNKKCNIHLKIDTGLSRLGIPPEKAKKFIEKIKKFSFINLRGIATHFSESQIKNQQFTLQQIKIFNNVLEKIKNAGVEVKWKHTCNSAGLFNFGSSIGNFFRPGLATYGYWPSDHIKKLVQEKHPDLTLQPALTWKTKIFDIKTIPAKKYVGYGRTYQTKKETVLACLPIGYQDGYNRGLSNCGCVMVNEKIAPVVGTIGMNITTIDITDIPNINLGQETVLIGNHKGIRASDLAALTNSNVREITTRISPNLPRILS